MYEPTFVSELLKQLEQTNENIHTSSSLLSSLEIPSSAQLLLSTVTKPTSQLLSSSYPLTTTMKKSSLIFPNSSMSTSSSPLSLSQPFLSSLSSNGFQYSFTTTPSSLCSSQTSLTATPSSLTTTPSSLSSSQSSLTTTSNEETYVKFKVIYHKNCAIIPLIGIEIDLPSRSQEMKRLWKMGNLVQAIIYYIIQQGCTKEEAARKFNVPYSVLKVYIRKHVRKIN